MGPREHIPPGFISLYKWRQARRGMLWLSNTILLGPAHKAWPWEEQTSRLPCPSRFADSGLQLPLTALGRGRRGAGGCCLSPTSTPHPPPTPPTLPLPGMGEKIHSPALNPERKTRPGVERHQTIRPNSVPHPHPVPSQFLLSSATQAPAPGCKPLPRLWASH